jgi:hypothetical protein
MQPSHHLTSHFLLWSRRAESLSCYTWQIEQYNSHSIYQGRHHRRSKNGCWNESYPPKIKVGWSLMLPTRCQWSSMVQGLTCDSERFWALLQDHGWGSLLLIFHPTGNKQDVSRLKEELLADTNEVKDCEVCGRMWYLSKSEGRSFETSRKSATIKNSRVEMREYMYQLHCGFVLHITWVQLDMGHCGPLD